MRVLILLLLSVSCFAQYGEITGGATRVYYKLSNTTDYSGNSNTLTNNNSVTFASGKFSNASDYGSSGTNKGLTAGTNPLSADSPTNYEISFWMKLNSTSNTARNHYLFVINSKSSATNGTYCELLYTISGGTLSLTAQATYSSVNATTVVAGMTADTNWHHVLVRKEGTTLTVSYDNFSNSSSGTGTPTSFTSVPTIFLAIGNNRGLTLQSFAMIDEFFITESFFTDQGNRRRYAQYTQGKFGI